MTHGDRPPVTRGQTPCAMKPIPDATPVRAYGLGVRKGRKKSSLVTD